MKREEFFMQRCLQLAKKGINTVAPNPMVGSVITVPDTSALFEERIVGEGYHRQYGEPHAEVNATLAVANQKLFANATLYVSLEPCSHFGKTPPCAHLIVKKGIEKVVVGAGDPNPKVSGTGIKYLRDHGVEVVEGVLSGECEMLNRRFNTFYSKGRPYVTLKWAQTANKCIARANYDSKWISNPYSRQLVHKWRSENQAIMVGTGTAIHDNPSLTTRLWLGTSPIRVAIDRELKIPSEHHLMDGQVKTLILNQHRNEMVGGTEFVQLSDFTPKGFLEVLHDRNIQSVFVEGGAKLIQSFIDANLWDEARVFTATTTFENGVKAPSIQGNIEYETQVLNDKLELISN